MPSVIKLWRVLREFYKINTEREPSTVRRYVRTYVNQLTSWIHFVCAGLPTARERGYIAVYAADAHLPVSSCSKLWVALDDLQCSAPTWILHRLVQTLHTEKVRDEQCWTFLGRHVEGREALAVQEVGVTCRQVGEVDGSLYLLGFAGNVEGRVPTAVLDVRVKVVLVDEEFDDTEFHQPTCHVEKVLVGGVTCITDVV